MPEAAAMIRSFRDETGGEWQVTLGRESWGVLVALFVARDGSEVRRTVLRAPSQEEASRDLLEMDDEALADLFRRSEPKGD